MLKKVIGAFVGLLVLFFVGGFILPSAVHVERSLVINAPPADIFPLISDLAEWQAWSPWAKVDPGMKLTVSGSGVGQTMSWQSQEVGSGTQQVTALESPHFMQTHLDFGEQGVADAAFSMTPQGKDTLVAWALDTDMRAGVPILKQPISTYAGFLMDRMVGQDYEIGLGNLKVLAEQQNP